MGHNLCCEGKKSKMYGPNELYLQSYQTNKHAQNIQIIRETVPQLVASRNVKKKVCQI